jgi:hypothetical protein
MMNPWLATACAALPLFSRWNQIGDVAAEHEAVKRDSWSYNAKAGAKALVNGVMLAITAYTALTYGSVAASWLLGSWCVSKLINLGDASPIEHFEDFFSRNHKAHPGNRQGLLSSLGANLASTCKATFYGLVAMSASVGLPIFGTISFPIACSLIAIPLISRVDQINKMSEVVDEDQKKYYRAQALVNTIIDGTMGAVIYTAATMSAFNPIITGGILAGWIGAKLSSGGECSPLDHLTEKTAHLFGANIEALHVARPPVALLEERSGLHVSAVLNKRDLAPSAPLLER